MPGKVDKILEYDVANVVEHNVHSETQEAGNNLSDPGLSVNNVLQAFQNRKILNFVNGVMTKQGTAQKLSAQTSEKVDSTPQGLILTKFNNTSSNADEITATVSFEDDLSGETEYLENLTQEYWKE